MGPGGYGQPWVVQSCAARGSAQRHRAIRQQDLALLQLVIPYEPWSIPRFPKHKRSHVAAGAWFPAGGRGSQLAFLHGQRAVPMPAHHGASATANQNVRRMEPDPRDRSICSSTWWAGCGARQHGLHALGHSLEGCVATAHRRKHRGVTLGVSKSGIAETPEERSNRYLWWGDTSVRLGGGRHPLGAALGAAAGATAERPT